MKQKYYIFIITIFLASCQNKKNIINIIDYTDYITINKKILHDLKDFSKKKPRLYLINYSMSKHVKSVTDSYINNIETLKTEVKKSNENIYIVKNSKLTDVGKALSNQILKYQFEINKVCEYRPIISANVNLNKLTKQEVNLLLKTKFENLSNDSIIKQLINFQNKCYKNENSIYKILIQESTYKSTMHK